jgi:hypothetical protein
MGISAARNRFVRKRRITPITPLTISPHTVLDRDIKSRTTGTTRTMRMIVSIKLPSLLNCRVREG